MFKYKSSFFHTVTFLILIFTSISCFANKNSEKSPSASLILGNPNYPAMSYGGYRGKTRDEQPTINDIKEDLRILNAIGIKIIRTYNTSQYKQAENLLKAIKQLKKENSEFEMFVKLGAWIECDKAWSDRANHHKENKKNNASEINKAIELVNNYPDIVKVIAVGNEAMVQWATQYFVYPKTILKWVNYLQDLKNDGGLPSDLWITSSDNYESWGGGNTHYHTEDLEKLIKAVDYVSLHTYPFHDSYYNPKYWGVKSEEESLGKLRQIELSMKRAQEYAVNQYNNTVKYIRSIAPNKTVHIGETGWSTIDNSEYGPSGSKAADELKAKLFYQYMREWSNANRVSLFYFEAFDEKWKDTGNLYGSENHFGLINLDNEVKYAIWDLFETKKLNQLKRGGLPLTQSYKGDYQKLLSEVLEPPYKSQMPLRNITTTNPELKTGESITHNQYIVVHETLHPKKDNGMTYPSNSLKINPWEGTCKIEMSPKGIVEVTTGTGDWWGSALEIQGGAGENLSNFENGYLYLDIKGYEEMKFNIGFQTGNFLKGTQVDGYIGFGGKSPLKLKKEWSSYKLPIALVNKNKRADLSNVTSLLFLKGDSPKEQQKIFLKNIFYSKN